MITETYVFGLRCRGTGPATRPRPCTYTLDVETDRIRSVSSTDGTTTTYQVNHYAADTDSPSWTDESGGTWTRPVVGLQSVAAITTTNGVTHTDWQLSNLHGDNVATIHDSDDGLTSTSLYTEYGTPKNAADTGSKRYGWLGTSERAADTPGGIVIMGVRLYNPVTGRFLQPDPVPGGSCNAYDYGCADPINKKDLDGRLADWFVEGALAAIGGFLPNVACIAAALAKAICGAIVGALFRPRLARIGWSAAVAAYLYLDSIFLGALPNRAPQNNRKPAAKIPPGSRGHSRSWDT
jgi:RHS repeat-associated protein